VESAPDAATLRSRERVSVQALSDINSPPPSRGTFVLYRIGV
jgi:hypothetical protein